MPLLSLHQNEDGNNQTDLFAVARAMYQHRALLMQIFFLTRRALFAQVALAAALFSLCPESRS